MITGRGIIIWKLRLPGWLLVVLGILLYIVIGAIIPFLRQPGVKEETKRSLDIRSFYGDKPLGERAAIISQNGEALEERIRLISQAKEEIILSTFEFDADISGKKMISALMDAAERGVRVRVVADGFPAVTAVWGNPYFLAFAQMEHVEFRIYNPVRLWEPWKFMGRLHDKYLIVDEKAYILGGRNTYDFFLGDQESYKNYDWDVLVWCEEAGENASVHQVKTYFEKIWANKECRTMGKSRFWKWNPSVKKAARELKEQYQALRSENKDWFEAKDYEAATVPVNQIRLVSNPTHLYAKEPTVFYTITELMKGAEKEVIFHTPYIICNDWMLERLGEVCNLVPGVQMMTNSVANNGNPFGAFDYEDYKGRILEQGVEILEYDGGISYHGKCFVVDERLSAVGSFNWDMRSVYLDTELMLVIDSTELNAQLREEMSVYEKMALKVVDEDTYDLPEGVVPQRISKKKAIQMKLIRSVAGWARFLM